MYLDLNIYSKIKDKIYSIGTIFNFYLILNILEFDEENNYYIDSKEKHNKLIDVLKHIYSEVDDVYRDIDALLDLVEIKNEDETIILNIDYVD